MKIQQLIHYILKTYLMQHQFHPLHRVEWAYSDEEQKQEPRNLESEIKKNLTQLYAF